MRKLLIEFKEFALGGSLVDLAIGIAIGVAFAGVVEALVADVILPLVADLFGSPNFDGLSFTIRGQAQIEYGKFLTVFVSFLLLAFVVLLLVKLIKKLTGVEVAGKQGSRECPHCASMIPVTAGVCMYCTRDVVPMRAEEPAGPDH